MKASFVLQGDVWLTTYEAAARARVSIPTIRRALRDGRLHGHQTGPRGRWRFRPEAVDAFVEGRNGRAVCCMRLLKSA